MTPHLAIIVAWVIGSWAILTVAALIGISVYRERHRRRQRAIDAERLELRRERAELDHQRRLLGL